MSIPKQSRQRIFVFFELLFCTQPTWIDVVLLIVGSITAIAAGVPFPLIGILFGQLVDDLNAATCNAESNTDPFQYEGAIDHVVVQIVYVAAAQFVLIYCYAACWNVQSQRLSHRLRERYFRSLLRQEPSFFDDKHAGEISTRLTEDFAAIESGASEKVGRLLGQLSFFVTAYVVAFIKQPVLAGILVSLVPAFLLMSFLGSHFFKKYAVKATVSFGAASSIASEALANIPVVQAFGAGPRLEVIFAKHIALARSDGIKKALVAATQAGLLYFIAYSSNALAYWQGSRMIVNSINGDGDATVGQIYTVVFLLVDACIILGSLAPLFPIFGAASTAYERVRSDMEHTSSIDGLSDEGIKLPWDTPGSIKFRDVSFAYPSRPDQPALKNVDMDFPAGKHTAIVGQSGSGKSTVAALLNCLYSPSSGAILFDDHDTKDLNVRNIRGFVSLVQQEAPLLDRSIFENIALGLVNSPRPNHESLKPVLMSADLERIVAHSGKDVMDEAARRQGPIAEIARLVQRAAELADLYFIDHLELGYSTQVGTGGSLVSGGQRQRIALARTLIRDPKILVLDEATAALDSATEKRIQAAIDRVAVGRTVVSIAHRLSTIKKADNIIVMRDGEVVEQGTYAALVERAGAFAHLVALQGLDSSKTERADSSSLENTDVESLNDDAEKSGPVPSNVKGEKVSSERTGPTDTAVQASTDDVSNKINDSLSSWAVVRGLSWLIRPDLSWLALAVPSAVVVGSAFTAMALIFAYTIGALNPCSSTASHIMYLGEFFGGLLFMLAVVEFLAHLFSWSSFGRVSENLLYRTRVLSFRTLVERSVQWHHSEGRNPSNLLSLITKDGASLGAFSGSIVGTAFSIIVNFLVAIIVSHVFAWKIALVCLAMVPILLASGILQIRATSKYQERSHKAFVDVIGITVEAVNQIKTIASFSLEDEIVHTYRRALAGPRKDIIKESLHTSIYLSISNSTGFFIYALSYWWGSQLIMRGEYSQTQFFVVQVSMLVSAQLWGQMFSLAPEFSRARSAASRIVSLINSGEHKELIKPSAILNDSNMGTTAIEKEGDAEAGVGKSSLAPQGSTAAMSVAFRDVHFAYPSRLQFPILKGTSFSVAPGQFVGLVGPSGAGKSTIMGLIQRMYSPTSGSIAINGSDISKRAGTDFRSNIAVVPQNSALFNGTIKFNVGLGARPGHDATDAEIEDACRTANLHETITSLPQGYDTECGPNGSRLSGGQRQRLAIARALVRKPGLLLLDESTSALDAESERALQVGLERIARDITIVAITHRLHTVQKADVILMVEGGCIVDRGTHGELMERSEGYRVNALQQML
ncbi:Uu.00g142830.m01.CDS01 [Anthostomella pinea]|uniref:Uu.00g142830.m01.CDS01 n=1 Tax=Anthostomella pinea TaxID=933095 RepID=A0AAI8YLK6_9PEZI|nr:Uu.00g142830.m01.CDS01 [Anthostomella pinea]